MTSRQDAPTSGLDTKQTPLEAAAEQRHPDDGQGTQVAPAVENDNRVARPEPSHEGDASTDAAELTTTASPADTEAPVVEEQNDEGTSEVTTASNKAALQHNQNRARLIAQTVERLAQAQDWAQLRTVSKLLNDDTVLIKTYKAICATPEQVAALEQAWEGQEGKPTFAFLLGQGPKPKKAGKGPKAGKLRKSRKSATASPAQSAGAEGAASAVDAGAGEPSGDAQGTVGMPVDQPATQAAVALPAEVTRTETTTVPAAQAAVSESQPAVAAIAWPPLRALDEPPAVDAFPWPDVARHLAPEVADYIAATSEALEIETIVVFQMVQAMISTLMARQAEIQVGGVHREPLVIWSMAFLPPGARKTPLLNQLQEDVRAAIGTTVCYINDLTAAGLREALLAHPTGPLGIVSAEGQVLRQAIASDALRDLLLKSFTGDDHQVARARTEDDPVRDVERPLVPIALLAQPSVLSLAMANEVMDESGFLDRMLVTSHRQVRWLSFEHRVEVPQAVREKFRERLQVIAALGSDGTIHRLRLSAAALERCRTVDQELQRHSTGIWRDLISMCHKATGHVLRVAGILSLLRAPGSGMIEEMDIEAAWQFVQHAMMHRLALRVSTPTGRTQHDVVRKVIAWIERREVASFTIREATQGLREQAAWTRKQWDPIFDLLVRHNYLRPTVAKGPGPKGGRPSPGFDVNPAVWGA